MMSNTLNPMEICIDSKPKASNRIHMLINILKYLNANYRDTVHVYA